MKFIAFHVAATIVLVTIFPLAITVTELPSSLTASSDVLTAENRTALTLNGLFNYYWKTDPSHKKIQFFFVCAQIGEIGTSKAGQCSCVNPSSCVNCYRWWSAISLEAVATYGILMNTTNHSRLPEMFYDHSPYNADWDAATSCTFIDDFLWYGIAYLQVYEWLGVSV